MRRLFATTWLAVVVFGGVGGHEGALAAGNSAAAHACNHGGYLHLLRGSDLTSFKNAGACVAYAAQPGNQLVAACTANTAESIGCLTFSNLALEGPAPGDPNATITLNGVITFATCLTLGAGNETCDEPPAFRPASGGGTYSVSGANPSAGTFQATQLASQFYLGTSPSTLVSCHDARARQLNFLLTLTPTGGAPIAFGLFVRDVPIDASLNAYELFGPGADFFIGPAPAGLITC